MKYEMKCRVCKCTEERACNPPCAWAEPGLCTTCHGAAGVIAEWMAAAHQPSVPALIREANGMMRYSPVEPGVRLGNGPFARAKRAIKRAVGR